jgi:hypothetical protein
VKQSKSVGEARAVEGPAWSVSEPSDEARLEVLDRVEPEFFFLLAFFRFTAGTS